MNDPRIPYGRLVRATWVNWAREQFDPQLSWLLRWDEVGNGQREVDMRIGEAVATAERERIRLASRAQHVAQDLSNALTGHGSTKVDSDLAAASEETIALLESALAALEVVAHG
jgi:hypothetical protein